MRLQPGFSWDDLHEDWRIKLEAEDLIPDAKLLALALSLLFVIRVGPA